MTELRLVGAEDKTAVQALWTYCFDDSEAFIQWYFAHYYRAENTLGVYDDQQGLIAATQIIPYTISLRCQPVDVGYVVGVSTAPEARRQGLGRRMLLGALGVMRERGEYLSLLMPFAGGFYYRYGWQFAYYKQQVAVSLTGLAWAAAPYGRLTRIGLGERLHDMKAVYRAFCAGRNGYVLRTDADWARLLADAELEKAYCCLLEGTGGVEGYALYAFSGETIRVLEMAYSSYQARAGLLDYFYGHRSHMQRLSWQAPADDPLVSQLMTQKEAVSICPYLMVRVSDVAGLLRTLAYPVDCPPLVMQIKDELAIWNDGCFLFAVRAGLAEVTPKPKTAVWDIAMDIGALGLLASGAASAQTLFAQGRLQAASGRLPKAWSSLWPEENNFINEDY